MMFVEVDSWHVRVVAARSSVALPVHHRVGRSGGLFIYSCSAVVAWTLVVKTLEVNSGLQSIYIDRFALASATWRIVSTGLQVVLVAIGQHDRCNSVVLFFI